MTILENFLLQKLLNIRELNIAIYDEINSKLHMCTMSVAQVYIYTVKQVIFTRCKFLEILQEGLVKVSARRCSFDCGFYCNHI